MAQPRQRRPELVVLSSRINNGSRFSQIMVPPLELDEYSTVSFRSLSCSAPTTFEISSGDNIIGVRIGAAPATTFQCEVESGLYKSYKTLAQAVANALNNGLDLVPEPTAANPKKIGMSVLCSARVDAKGRPVGYTFGLRSTIPTQQLFTGSGLVGLTATAAAAGGMSLKKAAGTADEWDASAVASYAFTRGSGAARWRLPLHPAHHCQVALAATRGPVPAATPGQPNPYEPAILGDMGTCLLYEEGSTYKVYYGRGLLDDTGVNSHDGDLIELRREGGAYVWYAARYRANPVFAAISNGLAIVPDAVPTQLYSAIRTPDTTITAAAYHTDIQHDPPPMASGTDFDSISDPNALQIDATLLGAEKKDITKYLFWNEMQLPLGFVAATHTTSANYLNSFSSDAAGSADGVSSIVVRLPSLPIRTRSYAQGTAQSVPTIAIVDRPEIISGRVVYTESNPVKLWVGGTGLQSVGELAIEIRDGGGDLLDTNGETVVQLVFE